MVINSKKTHSMTIATRQNHQLLPLSFDLLLHGVKVEQLAEHRLLGIITDNKLRWDTHTDTLCKTLAKRVVLLSKLKYIVDSDTLKLFLVPTLNPTLTTHPLCGAVVVMLSEND